MGFTFQIEEGSENSEQLFEDDGNVHEMEGNDLEIERNDLEIEGNEVDIKSSGLEIEGNGLDLESNGLQNDCDQILEIEDNHESNGDDTTAIAFESGISQGKDHPSPVVRTEFESVKSSWTKRNSKEKRGAVLCYGGWMKSNWNTITYSTMKGRKIVKSYKKMEAVAKRKVEPTMDVEARTIKLYRTPVVDPLGYGSSNSLEGEISKNVDRSKCLKLKKGDSQIIYNYFSRIQLTNPNFVYLMDLNDEGYLRNEFWIDSRSMAAYVYFGRPLQTIITDQCRAMQGAISVVFPKAHHRLHLSHFMQSILENLGELQESDNAWLRTLYEERKRWVPVYLKRYTFCWNVHFPEWESMSSFFDGYLSKLYTNEIFRRFRDEFVMMPSCFSIKQVHANGPVITYLIAEREGGDQRDIRNFEVMYDKAGSEIHCICSCLNFNGYPCRYGLCILNFNGLEEIPFQYIFLR
ncbi:protein FAR1-RELATED SEQUENCE 6-like [Durio zibethinus]|uniref:Protein FAR1-RELATED SEQUENCE n=1 Tax=Durio zibethinus TaxID=66656 RepID=A0A6P5X5X6_DURZI|nr:protein FAR1-RELATED SEQUENCE 6-like [Durio zibethinus]